MPEKNNSYNNYLIIVLIMGNLILDQLSKYLVRIYLVPHDIVEVFGRNLVFMRVENTGAFLSAGEGLNDTFKFITLTVLPFAALCAVIVFMLKYRSLPLLLVIGLSFVAGGGLGNLFDRFQFGSVTDFIHLDFLFIKTGIFNLADVSILVGVICLALNIYYKKISTIDRTGKRLAK
ncbi:signal peptidase II [Pedobacter antarcticus]|uniref:signal peptidase II n=1 Tax=Pedobacter antarcticus TaxID=34086 RepID=UPI001C583672|nr:signal peptidase II [Pedobacter antarcticus]